MEIRKIGENDIDEIYSLGTGELRFQASSESSGFWTKEQLMSWAKDGKDILLCAVEDEKIIGYVLCQTHTPTRKTTIENLYVDKKHRGKGIGKSLVSEAIRRIKEKYNGNICGLVEPDNLASIKSLEASNFVQGKEYVWMHLS